jgi:hypothetical protein
MSETLTLGQLREIVQTLPGLEGDYTNIEAISIRPHFQRIVLVPDMSSLPLDQEQRELISACNRLRLESEKLKKEGDKYAVRLRAIRNQIRTRKPALP